MRQLVQSPRDVATFAIELKSVQQAARRLHQFSQRWRVAVLQGAQLPSELIDGRKQAASHQRECLESGPRHGSRRGRLDVGRTRVDRLAFWRRCRC